MGDDGPIYPPDPETDYPPQGDDSERQPVDPPDAADDLGGEEPADDFDNPHAGNPEGAGAYRDGYREGAFGEHNQETPDGLPWEMADIWREGNEAGQSRFAVYRKGYRAGIEAGLTGEPAPTRVYAGDLAFGWANGIAAGADRAADIHRTISEKASASFGFEKATGRIHEFPSNDRRWYAQEFDDGVRSIFLGWPDQAFAMDEWIYPKYKELHGPQGKLGMPVQDSGPVGNGVVGTFRAGNIYWSEHTGAHEVRGKIRDLWLSRGEPDDPAGLGYPISDRYEDPSGGWVQSFERSDIYQWGPELIISGQLQVRYKGLNCFGETDGEGSDEPFPIISAIGMAAHPDGHTPGPTISTVNGPEVSADGGGSYPADEWIWSGRPSELSAISVTLMEHDEGDKDEYKKIVNAGVTAVVGSTAGAIAVALAPTGLGIPVAAAVVWLAEKAAPLIADAINDLLGTSDDLLGVQTWTFGPHWLIQTAQEPAKHEQDIEYRFGGEGQPISRLGGSYKVYFDVLPV